MEPTKISNAVSRNEKLLIRLKEIVMKNLENEYFGVSDLSKQIGISRSQLHRILKKHLKKSVSQFIRDIRLEEALKLLMKDVGSVSEIAYKVGFNSPNYFSKCFNERYGFTPGESLTKYSNNELNDIINEFVDYELYNLDGDINASKYLNKKTALKALIVTGMLGIVLLSSSYLFNNQIKSLAVLPLVHNPEDSNKNFIANGIQESLIWDFGQLFPLKVISENSTINYLNSNKSIKQIAHELGVEAILNGSITEHSDSLFFNLKLVKVFPLKREIWSSKFTCHVDNAIKGQNTVLKEIAKKIKIDLSPDLETKLLERANINIETHKAYVRGMYYINKSTKEDFSKGIAHLNRAIEIDPANPLAYTGLAMGYAMIGHGPNPSVRIWKRGKAAALRAIKLDSTLAQAHAALAIIKNYNEWDWEGAEKAFLRSIEINPNMVDAHFYYAWYLAIFGRFDEAIKEHLLAKKLDPLTPIYSADLGSLYYWAGFKDKALTEAKQALELDPEFGHGWWVLGNVYVAKGMFSEAIKAHMKAYEINPVWKWALGCTYAMSGNLQRAREILEEIKTSDTSPRRRFGMAFINVTLGDIDEAFRLLNQEPPDVWLPWIRTWPEFKPLREDPRFNELLVKYNLPSLP